MGTGINYAAHVARGAGLLDERKPGWEQRIDLDELDISSCDSCVLGQLYGSYAAGVGTLGMSTFSTAPTAHGFALLDEYFAAAQAEMLAGLAAHDPRHKRASATDVYAPLTAAWRELITARRQAAGA